MKKIYIKKDTDIKKYNEYIFSIDNKFIDFKNVNESNIEIEISFDESIESTINILNDLALFSEFKMYFLLHSIYQNDITKLNKPREYDENFITKKNYQSSVILPYSKKYFSNFIQLQNNENLKFISKLFSATSGYLLSLDKNEVELFYNKMNLSKDIEKLQKGLVEFDDDFCYMNIVLNKNLYKNFISQLEKKFEITYIN
ncbi:hypothetical protein BI336_05290 [Listeria monocytogenes]|nr:hypothetical protein [Listeria monocytogenes]